MLGLMAAAAGAWFLAFHGVVPVLADEAYQALAGFGLAEGIRFPYYSTWPIHAPGSLAQGRWPLMSGVYEGLPGPYLLFPLWKLLGVSLGSVRLADALCALASAGLFVGAAKEFFGKRAAAVLGALIFLNAHFLIAGQTCLTAQTALIWLCLGGLLYSLARWSSGASRRWLGLAGFSLGLGLWAKIVFLWYALAVPPALLLLKRRLKPADWAAFCGWFVVGAAPLIYFNACARWRTVTLMAASLTGRTTNKVDNLDLLSNVFERLREIRDVLTFDAQFNWFVPARLPWALRSLGFLALAPAAGFYGLRKAPPARFLLAVLAVVSFGLCFTVSWFATYQLLWAAPVYLMLAASVLSERIKSDRVLAGFLALALLPGWAVLAEFPAMCATAR
jgi:4-amino-4-deoxy-L-arabinose transferase-like glycosyltransferase